MVFEKPLQTIGLSFYGLEFLLSVRTQLPGPTED
jgi:hypothetical protein